MGVIRATIELRTDPELTGLVSGLALASLAQMRRRNFPPLYSSGVRYRPEARTERWQLAQETLDRRSGDCEDLVAYRVAELWRANIHAARPWVQQVRPGLRHVVCWDGTQWEDPSARLGMPRGKGYREFWTRLLTERPNL